MRPEVLHKKTIASIVHPCNIATKTATKWAGGRLRHPALRAWLEQRPIAVVAHLEELLEVDLAASVFVERAEHVFVEGARLAVRKHGLVDVQELTPGQLTARAVLLQAENRKTFQLKKQTVPSPGIAGLNGPLPSAPPQISRKRGCPKPEWPPYCSCWMIK